MRGSNILHGVVETKEHIGGLFFTTFSQIQNPMCQVPCDPVCVGVKKVELWPALCMFGVVGHVTWQGPGQLSMHGTKGLKDPVHVGSFEKDARDVTICSFTKRTPQGQIRRL